jgi:SAM-dependent methyltransferase
MIKLNLGCGNDIKNDYINCDLREDFKVDRVFDITETNYPFENNSVDEIYCYHVLEHIQLYNWYGMIKEWKRILNKKGTIVIGYPDLKDFIKKFINYRFEIVEAKTKEEEFEVAEKFWEPNNFYCLNGAQKNKYDNHVTLIDDMYLILIFKKFGFKYEKSYDKNGLLIKFRL